MYTQLEAGVVLKLILINRRDSNIDRLMHLKIRDMETAGPLFSIDGKTYLYDLVEEQLCRVINEDGEPLYEPVATVAESEIRSH